MQSWDEFSFWASSAKIIYTTNALFDQNSPIFFKTYPPIQQLFQYYTLNFLGWSEKYVLYAQGFWVLSGLLCVCGSLIQHKLYASLAFVVSCCLPFYFGYSFSTIYSDALLGVAFAACLCLAFGINQDISRFRLIAFAICAATLTLIKEIAVVLVFIATAVFLLKLIFGSQHDNSISETRRYCRGSYKALLFAIVGITTAIIVSSSTWSWYVRKIDAVRQLTLPSVADLNQVGWQLRLNQTLTELWQRVLKPGYLQTNDFFVHARPSLVWTVVVLVFFSLLWAISTDKRQRRLNILVICFLCLGSAGYLIVLLISYLFIFTEYEGVRLASFERYISTYMLAWSVVIFACWIQRLTSIKTTKLQKGLVTLALLIIVCGAPRQFYVEVRSINSVGQAQLLRETMEDFAAKAKLHMMPSDKIYFIAQNSNGLERVMFYYAMLPYTSSTEWCWSLGQKYFEGDVWTCNTALANLLKGYTHLALYRGDSQFWAQSGMLFDPNYKGINNTGIFKIDRHADDSIKSIRLIE